MLNPNCFKCFFARKIAEDNMKKGFCGCSLLLYLGQFYYKDKEQDEILNKLLNNRELITPIIYTGWIASSCEPKSKKKLFKECSMVNEQLIVKDIEYCRYYKPDK